MLFQSLYTKLYEDKKLREVRKGTKGKTYNILFSKLCIKRKFDYEYDYPLVHG